MLCGKLTVTVAAWLTQTLLQATDDGTCSNNTPMRKSGCRRREGRAGSSSDSYKENNKGVDKAQGVCQQRRGCACAVVLTEHVVSLLHVGADEK